MHELAITQDIVELILERIPRGQVKRVVLHIGKLSAVLPDAVQFCFAACTEGTRLHGATLEIVELPAVARCRACGARLELVRPYGLCGCGGSDLEWQSGDELTIKQVEVT